MLRRMDPRVLTIVGGVMFVGVGVVASTVGGAIGAALFRRSAPPPSGGRPASLPGGPAAGLPRPVSHPACPGLGAAAFELDAASRFPPVTPAASDAPSTRLPRPDRRTTGPETGPGRRSAFVAARAARRVLTPQTSLRLHSVLSRSPCRSRPTPFGNLGPAQ